MSEADTIDPNSLPLTVDSLTEQLAASGLSAGQTVLVHTRMSALGWIAGGPVAVIQALLRVLGPSGTLMMPAFSPDTTEPANWVNPPVPPHWVPIIRQHTPAFDPAITPTFNVGIVAELFRRWPGTLRSAHPEASFAAVGPNAAYLLGGKPSLTYIFDSESPPARLYELDGHVLMLGLDHSKNTSLHMAEYRADLPHKFRKEGVAMYVDGVRQWVSYDFFNLDDSDFSQLGADYEAAHAIVPGRVGRGEAHFTRQRPLVDFAVTWMEQHRR
ncbi:MAG: AAC(3) family N-acetyltransferase [Chloroflexi bacterium]|nr:AAC(3) family N-acetyltransferase [Chloroflexota bacterium]